MSEANEEPTPSEQEPQGDTDWKVEARKWEARAKENKGASDELKKLRDAQMSELEKAKAEAEEAKAEAQSYKQEKERAALVNATAAATGVPPEVLRGSTKEEIEAHAESLKEYFAKPTAPTINLGKPSNNEPAGEREDFARKLFGRE
ncbi:MAG: hypothetical protein RR842_08170 [Gordonibacter sp.]|uniref:hypothetical protein n=1 Tax=Gordonibacter sp. TaxID=1968902 RepID=UPI002FC9EFD3